MCFVAITPRYPSLKFATFNLGYDAPAERSHLSISSIIFCYSGESAKVEALFLNKFSALLIS